MQLRYLRNETQAQATTAAPAVGSRQRVEAFEHATDGVVRYARAAIGNIDAHATGFPLHRDVDHAATRREVDGIVEQVGDRLPQQERIARSEEHTSELQSLMRISYAVFCLKKKKQQQ